MPSLVLHVDMDAFFASVEIRSDPRLDGKPLVVGGGPGRRGVVTTASYTARGFGIRSGMSLAEARRLCPNLLFVPVNPRNYVHESLRVLALLDRFSPRVEAASIDEAYVEFPAVDLARWRDTAVDRGEAIRSAIRKFRGLPASVGGAVNKLQAKMATRLAKPDGMRALEPGTFLDVFGSAPASTIPGIGPRTAGVLQGLGIHTVGELALADPAQLRETFGPWAGLLRDQARGEDSRPFHPRGAEPAPQSASHETTFPRDVRDPRELRATIWMLSDRVARRLRVQGMLAGTVAVRWKRGLRRAGRQRSLAVATDDPRVFARTAWDLLEASRDGAALRLIGVAGLALRFGRPAPDLFESARRRRELLLAGDRIRDRFGEFLLLPGGVFLEGGDPP